MAKDLRKWVGWIAVPPALAVLLFAIMCFSVFLPMFEDSLIAQKKEGIQRLTEAAWSVLKRYGDLEKTGKLSRAEAQSLAAEAVRDMRYGPDGLGYFWISDTRARMVMHPHQPELEGEDLKTFEDHSGKRLFVEMAERVRRAPGGFVEYVWAPPEDPADFARKLSHVRKYDRWGWIVGTGVYTEDIWAELADVRQSVVAAAALLLAGVMLVLLLSSLHIGWTQRQHRKAKTELQVVSSALESAANAIVIADARGRIQWVNPAFTHLTGYEGHEVIGKNPRILKSGVHEGDFYREMWQTIRRGEVWHGEITNRRKDGGLYTEEMTLTPVVNSDKQVSHFIAVKQDVTERRRHREELRAAMEAADAANRAKSAFLAKMSHELRTPLNSIIGFTELMIDDQRDPPAEKRARRLEKVHRNAKALLHLINDILDLSKVEAERLELEREPFDVVAMLAECVESAHGLLKDSTIELESEVDASLQAHPVWTGDGVRLRQVVLNLLSNAIKFTDVGRVQLRAWRDDTWLKIAVKDTGIGIAEEHLATVFGEFAQVDASSTRRAGGTGLGLAICQKLCRLMGGEVAAESTLGAGSTFTIRLPSPGAASAAEQVVEQAVCI